VRVTGTAQRDAWLARTFPPVELAGPDLWSVPVPIPDSPLRYTLTYLVAAGSGLVVVDPGWDSEAGWQALAAGLRAAGASPADVTGIVVTHIHPDHHGLSARLRDACGGWVAMHPAERDSLSAFRWLDGDARRDDLAWLCGCGVPDDIAAGLAVTDEALAAVLAMAKPDILLDHGDLVPLVIAILARRGPATVWQVTQELSWSRGWASVTGFMRRAAIAEAAAHLRHLADEGRIRAATTAAGGPERYSLRGDTPGGGPVS
jgi:Metallo-beta-lactamase superfamily